MRQRLAEFTIMFCIGVLSLGLLAYVGNREASTKYPKFELEKVISQSRPIQTALEKFLNAGLPLAQFAGFDTLVGPIVRVDDAIDSITILGRLGNTVFQQKTQGVDTDPIDAFEPNLGDIKFVDGPRQIQIYIPLKSRFAFSGQLVIHVPKSYVNGKISSATAMLPWAAGLGALALGIYGMIALNFSPARRIKLDRLIFALIFLSTASTVVVGLTRLYAEGSQSKAEGFGLALTERLRSIYDLRLSFDDLDGIESTLESYRTINPEIRTIALIVDNKVEIGTNAAMVGQPFKPDQAAFGVLSPIDGIPGLNAKIYVSLPYQSVLAEVGRTAKTFVVLLVASGFMAGLFFQLGGALRRLKDARIKNATDGQSAVDAIKPVLFVGFLIENLSASFLPQLMHKSAAAAGLSPTLASFMFMSYFVAFAVTLVPAGKFAGERGAKPLILVGAVLVAIAAVMMAISEYYAVVVASRLLSGIGQGLLFIGSQSYILAYAAADKRTQSAGIIVYTFNGGMLSGLVIGGLLAGYIETSGVFWIAAISAIAILTYTASLLDAAPLSEKQNKKPIADKGNILQVFKSRSFLSTTLFVGIPAKAVLTGVVFFAMPLLLTGLNLAQEDIGQIIMFYALGVLLSSHFISRYADRGGSVPWILFSGLVLSGLGLLGIGAIGWGWVNDLKLGAIALTIVLLVGTFLVGLGHGCINAPVVTEIAGTDVSRRLGEAQVTAFYRFIERFGHILGPILVGQLFFLSNQSPLAIAWLGGSMIGFALLYIFFKAAKAQPIAG